MSETKALENTPKQIEARFTQLAKKFKQDDWNSPEFLVHYANKIKQDDPCLSARLLIRVENLKKQQANIQAKSKISPQQFNSNIPNNTGNQSFFSRYKKIFFDKKQWKKRVKTPFFGLVLLPIALFSVYQIGIASPQFESRAKVIVQQPDSLATMDTSMAFLSGFGVNVPGVTDAQLLNTFIYSEDMLNYLNEKIQFSAHYSQQEFDWFSRLEHYASIEDLYDFYQSVIQVEVDETSLVIAISAKAFTPEYAQILTDTIKQRAEWYINKIGHELAESQLKFVQGEHIRVEQKLFEAKNQLLSFQDKYQLLDPEAEGMALQQITYQLEAKLAEKNASLKAVSAVMTEDAPQVLALQGEIKALEAQLLSERGRLSNNPSQIKDGIDLTQNLSVGAILSTYTELKVTLELALQAYTSSQISLEKSRIEAYRQLKYLVTVEAPTLPQDNKYPDVIYNITLFSILLLMLYWIGRIIIATINELK